MGGYMVEIIFPKHLDEKFYKKIPEHRKMINRLITEGVILSYALSNTRDKLWIAFSETDEEKIREIIYNSPISAYFLGVTCIPLLFHEGISAEIPNVWLN
jgi:hypothetical protein